MSKGPLNYQAGCAAVHFIKSLSTSGSERKKMNMKLMGWRSSQQKIKLAGLTTSLYIEPNLLLGAFNFRF